MRARAAFAGACLFAAFAAGAADPLPRARPEEAGMSSARLERLAAFIRSEIEADRVPGAVVAIARRGRLVYYESFGYLDKERGIAMPKDAIFAPASMEKPMVAVAALQLVEQGRIAMSDPVEMYLPQLANMQVAVVSRDADGKATIATEPQRRKFTIQDLMRHTSGLTYGRRGDPAIRKLYPISSNWAAEHMTSEQFLAQLGRAPLFYQPGTKWDYSFGYDVLGLVIEKVSGRKLGQYMHDNLFAPLGMVDTAFVIAPEKRSRYAEPLPSDLGPGHLPMRDVRLAPRFDCGGGCASYTAADYLRFGQMLLDKGELDGTRILSRKTVEYMTSDHLGAKVDATELDAWPNTEGYGFGLGVAVRRRYGGSAFIGTPGDFHWAGANGTHFWVDPKEQLVVVYMAHTRGERRFRFRAIINALVTQAIDD